MSCQSPCTTFDNTKKFYASLYLGLIAAFVFLLFSSKYAYQLTGFLGTHVEGSKGNTPTTRGVILHALVAGLVALGFGYLIMEPWKKPSCSCPMNNNDK